MTKQSDAHEALVLAVYEKLRTRGVKNVDLMDVRSTFRLIAERLGEVTEEMRAAWEFSKGGVNSGWRAMLAASALVPGDGK